MKLVKIHEVRDMHLEIIVIVIYYDSIRVFGVSRTISIYPLCLVCVYLNQKRIKMKIMSLILAAFIYFSIPLPVDFHQYKLLLIKHKH